MINKKSMTAAFTLIELLVVITIIGILAGIALPVFGQVQEKGQQTKSLASAKQIGLALKLYATDNEGQFPNTAGNPAGAATTPTASNSETANSYFRNLFPTYCSAEKLFYTPKSAWCKTTAPDEVAGTTSNCLAAGENNYAYIRNLTDTSNAALPLVLDGLADGNAAYSTDRTLKGGVWGGKKAVIIHVDDSGEVATCDTTDKIPKRKNSTGNSVSILDTADSTNWLGTTNTVAAPIAP